MSWRLLMSSACTSCEYASCPSPSSRRICLKSGLGSMSIKRILLRRSNLVYVPRSLPCGTHESVPQSLCSRSMALSYSTTPQSTFFAMEILFGTWNGTFPFFPSYMTSVKVCIVVRMYPSAVQRWLKMRHGKGSGSCPVQVALLAVGLLSTAQVEMASIIR